MATMNNDSKRCAKLCGNCINFKVLDDASRDPCRWFGVCWLELERDLEYECEADEMLDWIYDHGRHGQDECEKPDEWFEED